MDTNTQNDIKAALQRCPAEEDVDAYVQGLHAVYGTDTLFEAIGQMQENEISGEMLPLVMLIMATGPSGGEDAKPKH